MNPKTDFSPYRNILMKIKNTVQSEKFMKLCAGCFFFGVGACTFAFVSIGVFVFFITPRPDPCDCVNLDAIKTSMNLSEKAFIVSQSPVDNTCEIVLETDHNRRTYYVSKNYVIEGQMVLMPGWDYTDEEKEGLLKLEATFEKPIAAFEKQRAKEQAIKEAMVEFNTLLKKHDKSAQGSPNINSASIN